MFDASDERDRHRWLRFSLKIAVLWAVLLGAVGYAVTGDLDAFWWGARLAGGLTVLSGLLGLVRHARGEARGQVAGQERSWWTPSRALTGSVRVLLGAAVVLATL